VQRRFQVERNSRVKTLVPWEQHRDATTYKNTQAKQGTIRAPEKGNQNMKTRGAGGEELRILGGPLCGEIVVVGGQCDHS